MKCPYCAHLGDKVVDSRESKEGEVIRRRRECLECGKRFTSYERIDEIPYMVVKKDGTRERFERQKLIAGLLKACEKRPVSVAALEAVADRVEATLQERPEKEIATADIGSFVMEELKRLDKVAYVRFASVYRHFRDNPRLILAGIGALVTVLIALLAIANGSSRFSPDFLSEFVLYALSAADLTMLVALVCVLARNIVKLLVERRRALPFARFRAKLVLLLLGMTFVPAVLVLIVGSELIRTSVDKWFNAPMDEILSSANTIASDYYHERQMIVTDHA